MMNVIRATLVWSLVSAVTLGVVPVAAKTPRPTLLYPIRVDVQFKDAKGRGHTTSIAVNIDNVNGCPYSLAEATPSMVQQRHPEYGQITVVKVTCHGPNGATLAEGRPKLPPVMFPPKGYEAPSMNSAN